MDPTINAKQMEMYADPDSRGGILEPSGIAEIKFRAKDQLSLMHNNDHELKALDSQLGMTDATDESIDELKSAIKEQIAEREALLKPVYLQAATEFCDLHDKTGRMKAVGVIKDAVPWERSREYFFKRAKRRMIEDDYVERLVAASDGSLDDGLAREILSAMVTSEEWGDNHFMIDFYDNNSDSIEAEIKKTRGDAIQSRIEQLQKEFGNL